MEPHKCEPKPYDDKYKFEATHDNYHNDCREALRREVARLEDAIEKASHESYDECCWQELQKLLGLGWKGKP